ncbi:MAG: ATP-binding protein [Lachnospiraceae bacterium]|nr:ATP-binding protein [Lachnospiraceae bacterium]
MEITKIVITGGPCGGKSSAIRWIVREFSQKGYTVIAVPETATELISGGVCPWTCGTNAEYQKCQMKLQLSKEAIFEQGIRTMPVEKVLMICDRGAMDNKAYMNEKEFAEVLAEVDETAETLLNRYDAVFHLTTAAKGRSEDYTMENNIARYESVEEAVELDDRLIACWEGHPRLRIIYSETTFEEKMEHLIGEINAYLETK